MTPTPVSHYPPVRHPETSEPGHFEEGIGYAQGRVVPVTTFVRHCPYHPFLELRGVNPCDRCASDPGPEDRT